MTHDFHNTDHHITQKALYSLLLQHIPDSAVKDATQKLIDLMEENRDSALFREAMVGKKVKEIMDAQKLSPQQSFALTQTLSLVMHLSRAATISAATAQIGAGEGQHKQTITRLIEKMSDKQHGAPMTTNQILRMINNITMDNVFTAHPTYIGDLDYTKELCHLDHVIAQGNFDAAGKSLQKLLGMQTLVGSRFTAQDETAFMTHHLEQAFDSIPHICRHYDDAFATMKVKDYNPLDLNLNLHFRSWGSSGDKDGNSNITCHSLGDAIATHRHVAIEKYKAQLADIAESFAGDDAFKAKYDFVLGQLTQLEQDPTNAGNLGEKYSTASAIFPDISLRNIPIIMIPPPKRRWRSIAM